MSSETPGAPLGADLGNSCGVDFTRHEFHPVVKLAADYDVYDFTEEHDEERTKHSEYGVGRFNEIRPVTYKTELFAGDRNIHMGVDLRAPVNAPVHAFADGHVHLIGYNEADGDYGYTLITRHEFDGVSLFALHGHLSGASLAEHKPGDRIRRGQIIARLGDRHENGNWPAHLHFQLSIEEPATCDMPGAVSLEERAAALAKYPDPRWVLGPLY